MNIEELLLQNMSSIAKSAAAQREPRLIFGEVIGVNPLRIRISSGADSYEIDEDFMIIGELCRRKVLKIPVDSAPKHFHTENEMLMDVIGTSPSGPVVFAPAGSELPSPTIPDPNDPSKQIPNPNFPTAPSVLSLKHKHSIDPALPEILLRRGVKKGDTVIMLRLEGGSTHYVIEPVNGTLNDNNDISEGDVVDTEEEQK